MSNPKPLPPRSIDSYGGIIPYLNATATEHGGMTGHKFAEYVLLELPDTKIRKQAMNTVTTATIKSWRLRLQQEKEYTKTKENM